MCGGEGRRGDWQALRNMHSQKSVKELYLYILCTGSDFEMFNSPNMSLLTRRYMVQLLVPFRNLKSKVSDYSEMA